MSEREAAVLEMLSQGRGTQTLLGSNGSVKERIQRFRAGMKPIAGSCGGVGGGWGNSPDRPELRPRVLGFAFHRKWIGKRNEN